MYSNRYELNWGVIQMSDYIFIPFLGVTLERNDEINLGSGFSITNISKEDINYIKKIIHPKSDYEDKIKKLSVGLKFTFTNNHLTHSYGKKINDYVRNFL